ncbi:hypothetical protein CEXT_150111 [Caerostris extrusa]|uniref:Uncharacterized protein n=1 Tax=Caerostris extrusa TaxID=172846 RepID=A0AAV4W975_CAEEX|nr:hypothetical protein CEXT_150111 [Caerostris extrusa]
MSLRYEDSIFLHPINKPSSCTRSSEQINRRRKCRVPHKTPDKRVRAEDTNPLSPPFPLRIRIISLRGR